MSKAHYRSWWNIVSNNIGVWLRVIIPQTLSVNNVIGRIKIKVKQQHNANSFGTAKFGTQHLEKS